MKLSVINKNNCVACGECKNNCPRQAISIYKGLYALVDSNLCVGCKKCEVYCPSNAITIVERNLK